MQLPVINENDAFDLLLDSLGPLNVHTNTKMGRGGGRKGSGGAERRNTARAMCSYRNKLITCALAPARYRSLLKVLRGLRVIISVLYVWACDNLLVVCRERRVRAIIIIIEQWQVPVFPGIPRLQERG